MIDVYSTNCPKCIILEKKLRQSNIDYNLINDIETVNDVASKFGIMEAPFVVKDNKIYNFAEAIKNLDSFR